MRNDLIEFRKARRWSQAHLAQRLGINQATVSRIERGKKPSGPVSLLLDQLMKEDVEPLTEESAA